MTKIKRLLIFVFVLLIIASLSFTMNLKVNALSSNENEQTYLYVRSTEYTISDSGRFNQPLDRITTSDYNYSPLQMKNNYMYITIKVEINIKEIDDGYQYIFLYNGVESNSTLLGTKEIEHGSGKLNETYQKYSFEFSKIPLSSFATDDIVLRYGASGTNDDNWVNSNLHISIEYLQSVNSSYNNSNEEKDYDYIRNEEYTITDEGRYCQPLDRIATSDYKYAPIAMKSIYSYVDIVIQIDIREVSDGYQYLLLYNGVEDNSKLLAEKQIEHYSGEENTNYKTYDITFESIPLTLFSSNDIVIRYSASGVNNDDWKNKNLKVSLKYNDSINSLSLDIKYPVYIEAGETKEFYCYLSDELNYVVETRGRLNTYLTIEGINEDTLVNDDGGVGSNACIGFKGKQGKIKIKLRFYSSSTSGVTELQIRHQQAVMYGFNYPGMNIDTTSDLTNPYSDLRDIYYTHKFSYNDQHTPAHMKAIDARGYARINSEIVFYAGHGGSGSISLPGGALYASNLPSMENTKVVVWASCESSNSENTGLSMTQAAVNKGARSAVGWPVTIFSPSAKTFTDRLFEKLASGATLKDACEYADDGITWPWDDIHKYEIAGKTDTTISSAVFSKASLDYSTSILISNLDNRLNTSSEWYKCEVNGKTRIYRTINGCLTNDFYIINENDGVITDIKHSNVYVDNKQVLPILKTSKKINEINIVDNHIMTLNNTRSYIVYYLINDVFVPIEIKYCVYETRNNLKIEKAICTNLNNGVELNYSDICC